MRKVIRYLTPKQKKMLDFISNYLKNKGYSPFYKEIQQHFKLKSLSTIHQYLETLKNKGYLKKENNMSRALNILKEINNSIEIPLLGYITAGEPIEAIENPETLLVSKQLLSQSGRHYALKVKGTSMVDDGIFDGDTIIIKEQKTADNGDTVVAIINKNEATLKKTYKEKIIGAGKSKGKSFRYEYKVSPYFKLANNRILRIKDLYLDKKYLFENLTSINQN